MTIPGYFQYCSSVVEFEVRDGDASRCSFIVQDCFGYRGFFALLNDIGYCSLRSLKNFAGIFLGIALNLYNAFGKIAIFTVLILPTQEHERSFHFCGVSFNFFLQRFKVLVVQVFTCLGRVTPRYFMLFVAIVMGDGSLISF